jgi:iron(III) transport system permease protein
MTFVNKIKSKLLSPQFILGAAVLFLAIICVYPFLSLFEKVLFPEGSLSFKYFSKVLSSKSTLTALKNTLIMSIGTALLSLFLAIPLSWLLTRTDIPNQSRWRSLFCLPYAIPPYIGAMAWIYLGNPTNGIFNKLLGTSILNIYTTSGLIWVMGSFFYTFILLSLLAALDRMDPSLEEAARLSGANPFQVFFHITLPIIFPSLMSGVLLVLLASAASFGVPAMIGNPAGIFLITTKIYTYQRMGSLSGIFMAGALSSLLLILAMLVLVVNQKVLSRNGFKTVGGKTSRPSVIHLRSAKWPLYILMIILFMVLFVFPVIGIMITALSKIQGEFSLSNFGFQNFYRVLFEMEETGRALWNSTKLAFLAAISATLLGTILSYINKKTKITGRGIVEIFASLPYSTPGTVLALAFILAFSSDIFGTGISLYNTLFLIGLAYVAKYLNFALRTTGDGFSQIDDCLAEAARISGASWLTTMRTIWFPLMKPALVASFFLVFMPAFSELTMTILLTGPGLETLGTFIFQLQEYGDASGGGAAVLALLIITTVFILNTLVRVLSKGKYGL